MTPHYLPVIELSSLHDEGIITGDQFEYLCESDYDTYEGLDKTLVTVQRLIDQLKDNGIDEISPELSKLIMDNKRHEIYVDILA
jgi:hypothetical protein